MLVSFFFLDFDNFARVLIYIVRVLYRFELNSLT